MKKGIFISLEGIEGAGKSSNAIFIEEYLKRTQIDVTTTREPGGTKVAEKIRTILKENSDEKINELSELLMIFSARSQNVRNVIAPALNSGNWVICDRFTDSTRAYQGGGRGLSMKIIDELAASVHGDVNPDYTFLFDAPVDVCMTRVNKRGKLDRFESENYDFFERVRRYYLELAGSRTDQFIVIDTNQTFSEVQQSIEAEIKKIISDN
ncbi:MAG: dTMP kinase [Gammaproteobacteria bacterium]|nr:dTMP kinase [Gammaproteobacteria bacterium]